MLWQSCSCGQGDLALCCQYLQRLLETGSFCSFCMFLQHVEFRNQQDLDHILMWQPPEVSPLQDLLGLLMPSPPSGHLMAQCGLESGLCPFVQVIQLYDSGGLSGYDYEGCPVWFDIIGTMDPKGLLMSASKQDMIRKRIKVCELLQHECELQSQKVSIGLQAACLVTLGVQETLGLGKDSTLSL